MEGQAWGESVFDKQAFVDSQNFLHKPEYRKIMHGDKFDEYEEATKLEWIELPESVNGTLIYYLMVELNHPEFSVDEFFAGLFYVGFPVYFTFYLQGLLLYSLWLNIPDFATDGNICATGALVQHAVLGVFMIFLLPSVSAIIVESCVLLKSDEVAFDYTDPEKICVYHLVNSWLKKLLGFSLIVLPEAIILSCLLYVGCGFILTSKDIGTIIINSVAIAFIMDIDNFSRDAFESEVVSKRASEAKFNSPLPALEKTFTEGIPHNHSDEESMRKYYITIASFSNIHKVVGVIIISFIFVFCIRYTYCAGDHSIVGKNSLHCVYSFFDFATNFSYALSFPYCS